MREGAIKKSGRIFGFVLGFYALCFGISSSPLVFALNPLKVISQYGHDIWQMEDGLPQSYVNSIIQSRSGYLWLGTQGGVVRFDGVRFFSNENGDALLLKASVVLVLLEDRQGNLWVGTDGKGLFRIKDANVVHFGEKEGFPFSSIWALCEDNSGNIWIGTDRGGLVRYHGDKFVAFTKKDGLLSNSIFAIYEDRDGSLWIGTDNGLNDYEHGILSSITRKDGLVGDFAYPVLRDKKGALWIGTDGGLNRLMDGKITSYTTKDGLLANSVWALQEDRDGNLWIGSKNGLNRFYDGNSPRTPSRTDFPTMPYGPFAKTERAICGWHSKRLKSISRWKIYHLHIKEGLPGDVASSIFQSSDGSFWFGTDGGGLAHNVDGRFTVYNTENGLSDNSVFCVREGKVAIWSAPIEE